MLSKTAQASQDLAVRVQTMIGEDEWDAADEAFADLQERTTRWLMANALRHVGLEQAEDLVADAHMALYRALSESAAIGNVHVWLRRVLGNKVVDHFRLHESTRAKTQPDAFWEQRERSGNAPSVGGESNSDALEPHAHVAARMSQRSVNALLDALGAEKPELRDVIEGQYFGDETVANTATRLQLTVDQVNKRRAAALRLLRRIATKQGLDHDL